MYSIRRFLTIGSVLGVLVTIIVAGIAIDRGVRSTLLRQFDESLEDKSEALASTVEIEGEEIEINFDDLEMSEFESEEQPAYLQLWHDEDDTVLYTSPSLGEEDLPRASAPFDEPQFSFGTLRSGVRVRYLSLRFQPEVDEEYYQEQGIDPEDIPPHEPIGVELTLARETASLDTLLFRLRAFVAIVTLVAGIAAALLLGFVIRRSLEPLGSLADRIAQLDDGDLSKRVHLERTPQEIRLVVDQLNRLLERLELAFERERTFSADIAHEFRTPLAGLRSTMEVALSQPRDGAEYEETLQESLQIVQRLQMLVERLLYLCRLDAGSVETEETLVDLAELVGAAWAPLSDAAVGRGLDVRWETPDGVIVATDPMLLEVAIRNLLENAVAYTNEGGYVSVMLGDSEGSARLFIVNSGSVVSQDRVPELLARFTRADQSRNDTGLHVGLGLALVNRIAAILHASIDVRAQAGGEFQVTLTLDKRDA